MLVDGRAGFFAKPLAELLAGVRVLVESAVEFFPQLSRKLSDF